MPDTATTAKTSAGCMKGVKRSSTVAVLDEYITAIGILAKAERVTKGVLMERALLAYMDNHPNGAGVKAVKAVAKVRKYAEGRRGYTPRKGGRKWKALVELYGPALYTPRPCFKWRDGVTAEREAAQGTALHCLWCDAHTKTGAEVLEHRANCPTRADLAPVSG